MQTAKLRYTHLFWWFTLIHAVLWVILPTSMRYALPHDTIEGAMWGQHLEWGYDKNPWMNAWLTRLGWEIGGTSGLGIYILSSAFIVLSFWAVWRLASKFLPPVYALISVFLLEGCINYTLVPQSFNDNLIELGLWPLMFLFFHNAIREQKYKDWLWVGITAGLSFMAKYYTAIPLILMFIFLLINKEARQSFFQFGIYLAFICFSLIILPHFIWLIEHQFITLAYAFNRTINEHINWWTLHFYYPASFGFGLIVDFLLPIVLLGIFIWPAKNNSEQTVVASKITLSNFDRQYLIILGIGPFIVTMLLSAIFGWRLYSEWGVPLVSLWGILLVVILQPKITLSAFKRFMIIIYTLMFLWGIGYVLGLSLDKWHKHSDNYPAQQIADEITKLWWEKYHKPLKYVAGSRYIAGYIAFYSSDHPSVYVEWNQQFSPWISVNEMKKYGAVFIQDDYYGTTVFGKHPDTHNGTQFPKEVLMEFPNIEILPLQYFRWLRAGESVPPIKLLIGYLPPKSK